MIGRFRDHDITNIVQIKKKTSSNPLMLARVKLHNYDQDSNEEDTKIFLMSLFSSIVYSLAFV